MQLAIHTLMLASLAAVVLFGKSLTEPPVAVPVSPSTVEPAPSVATPTPSHATIARPFGASVRAAPSWEADGLYIATCGLTAPVVAHAGGWVKIQTEDRPGWVAASRVVLGDGPAPVDCAGRQTLHASADTWTVATDGCLSLRNRPSTESAELACVGNGHAYAVVDGPFDPGAGGDWFRVSSPTTGTGWVQADHLQQI